MSRSAPEASPEGWSSWPFGKISVSAERKAAVLEDIVAGSAPRPIYYLLLGLSVLIAGFGLLIDSPAVVIGAMLVSPLMTPIFGISVGLSRSNFDLLRNALMAEFGGVVLAIFLSFLLGVLPLAFAATPEMLARTSPTLVDLLVAALAGLAGCLAMIDERMSPALPGVAISTALTPPLATCGLSLAFGAYAGAWGAFVLFFANFLAILAVATVTFLLAGFFSRWEIGTASGLVRRFSAAGIGLLLVTVLLTYQLVALVQERRTVQTIRNVLQSQLAHDPNVSIATVMHNRRDGRLTVLSVLRAAHVLTPHRVKVIEDALSQRLGEPVDLFFRCSLTKDVGATGTASLNAQRSLDGGFAESGLSAEARIVQVAEQTVREALVNRPTILLRDVTLLRMPVGPVIVASVQSPYEIVPLAVERLQQTIRDRLDDPSLVVVVRDVDSSDITSKGRVLFGAAHFASLSEDEEALVRKIEESARQGIERIPDMFAPSVDAVRGSDGWKVRAEVMGARIPTPAQVRALEKRLGELAGEPVGLLLWARTELVVTREGFQTSQDLIQEVIREHGSTRYGASAGQGEAVSPPRDTPVP